MDLQLNGKKAFISCSTSGIGFGIAAWLLKERVEVMINGRTQASVDDAVAKLQSQHPTGQVNGVAANFAISKEVEALKPHLVGVDILINNVGIYSSDSFFDITDSTWFEQFEVNVMSAVRLSRMLLQPMLDNNWGRIIFISSECASLVPRDMISYSTSKSAMHAVSRGLANMTKGTGVTVNTVMPGSTLTEGAESFLAQVATKENKTIEQVSSEFFSEVRTSSLLQRFASVDEIASTVCYLASPLASATNGASIKIDGGSTGGTM